MGFYLLALLALWNTQAFTQDLKLSAKQQRPATLYHLKSLSGKYTRKMLVEELRSFVNCCSPGRLVGTKGHEEALNYLKARLSTLGGEGATSTRAFAPAFEVALSTYENDFQTKIAPHFASDSDEFKKWRQFTNEMKSYLQSLKGKTGHNLVWEKRGSVNPEQVLIIGASFDSINMDRQKLTLRPDAKAPGADDNGSGVAIALGLIQVLAQIELPKTVRVVFFDYGEFGALGSLAYLKDEANQKKEKEQVVGLLNLLMLGHDSKLEDKSGKEGNMSAYIRAANNPGHKVDQKFIEGLLAVGKKISPPAKFALDANEEGLSDATHFWAQGLPAAILTGDWVNDPNLRQHTSNDFVETINQKSFYNNYKFILGAVVGWAYDIVP